MRVIRILSFISAILFLLSFCACHGYVKHKPSSSNNSGSASSEESSSSVVSVPSHTHGFDPYEGITDEMKGVTVKLAIWEDYYSKINYIGDMPMASIYEDIGIRAEYVSIPESGYVAAISSKIASGDAPDVFKISSSEYFPLTLEIAAPINKVSTVNLSDPIWDQSLINLATINDDVYLVNAIGSPWNIASVLYYDKAFFEENGIKTPSEHYEDGTWTWKTFEKTVRNVKSVDPTNQGALISLDTFMNSQGHSLLPYNGYTQTFSSGVSNDYFKAYNEYNRLKNDGIVVDYANTQDVAMWSGTVSPMTFAPIKPSDAYNNVGFTYLPSVDEDQTCRIPSEFVMFGIVEGSENANAAGYFLRYWLDSTNFDLTNRFYNKDHGNFYYELTNVTSDQKYFNFEKAGATLLGKNLWSDYESPAGNSAPATALNTTVGSAKELLNKKISERIYNTQQLYGQEPVRND